MKPNTSPEAVAERIRIARRYGFQVDDNLLEALAAERDALRYWDEQHRAEGRRAGLEEAAKVAETYETKYAPNVSSIDVRASYYTGPKWRDGPSIATAIRALAAPQKECPMMIADQLAAALKTISEVKREAAKERRILLALIADLSDALTDEGPAWSTEGLEDMRRRSANALPPDMCPDWLIRYALVEKGYQK